MKFWQLHSLVEREAPGTMERVASSNSEWDPFADWIRNFNELCDVQDRAKLDAELPRNLVIACLAQVGTTFFVSMSNTVLRSRRHYTADVEIGAVEAFCRFGGTAMEDAQEYGSFKL